MVGFDSGGRPQNTLNFTKGQEVEAKSDKHGFRAEWYTAKILESPSKKRKKITVEYKKRVKEDGLTPLTELVDLHNVRPSLPHDPVKGHCNVFKENDAVEAVYRDGWWAGVVTKVLEESSRYRVYLDDLTDVIDFNAEELRPQMNWVNGKWVSPEKKQQTTGSIFSSGTAVEVNIDKENVRDAWFPAVVIKENDDSTFLVKYQSLGNSDEAGIKVNVDFVHIRPVPHFEDKDFELLENVDAHYDGCWRSGLVTKLLTGRRYNIYFKHGNVERELKHTQLRHRVEWIDGKWKCKDTDLMRVPDTRKELGNLHSSSDIPDMSAKEDSLGAPEGETGEKVTSAVTDLLDQSTHGNGKTPPILPPSKKIKLAAPNDTSMRSCFSRKSTEDDAVDVPSCVATPPLTKMPTEMPQVETLQCVVTRRGKRSVYSRRPTVGYQIAAETESSHAEKKDVHQSNSQLVRIKNLPEKIRQQKVAEVKSQKLDIVTMKGRHTKSPFKSPQASSAVDPAASINESEDRKKGTNAPVVMALEARGIQGHDLQRLKLMKDLQDLNDSPGGKNMELNQDKHGGSSQRRKRGRPRKLVTISQMASKNGKEDHGIQDVANEVELPNRIQVQSTGAVLESDSLTKEADMAVTTASKEVVDDDQPLSTWISAGLGSPNRRPSDSCGEMNRSHIDLATISSAKEAQDGSTMDGKQSLPFIKKSLVWKTIESLEIFQFMPQKPHFCPLADCKEEYREGSAIGFMVTFASLFDKISSLKFDDGKSVFLSTLESLVDLEKHGFDVTVPRNRVKQLLSVKEGKEELLNESKDVEERIKECTDESQKLNTEIEDIEKKITKLREELAASKKEMETKKFALSRMQQHMDSLNKHISEARGSFETVATAPWKLP